MDIAKLNYLGYITSHALVYQDLTKDESVWSNSKQNEVHMQDYMWPDYGKETRGIYLI